jgi:hypothetical protein
MKWYKINDKYSLDLDKIEATVVDEGMLEICMGDHILKVNLITFSDAKQAKADIDAAMFHGNESALGMWRDMPIMPISKYHDDDMVCESCGVDHPATLFCGGHYFCCLECVRHFDIEEWSK